MRNILLACMMVLGCVAAMAQKINHVSGQVTYEGVPIENCNVAEVDKNNRIVNSTVTDESGMFTISINNSAANRLQISADGMVTQLLNITKVIVRVKMQPKSVKVTTTKVEAVDLGLGVKWADRNIGANAPQEYGAYLSWGETEEKDEYIWCCTENYDKCLNYTKYDAAGVLWRERWQMPTLTDVTELMDLCTWQWERQEGVTGFKVTGPNGNSIFLPAGGYRDGADLREDQASGCYWTATPYEGMTDCAYGLQLSQTQLYRGHRSRAFGFLVRPVWK